MLSTGGMLEYAEALERVAGGAAESAGGAPQAKPREAVVATEIGMLHPLRMAAPDVSFIPANPKASCKYMKMITLPKLRDALREMQFEVRVPEEIAVGRGCRSTAWSRWARTRRRCAGRRRRPRGCPRRPRRPRGPRRR